MNKKEFLNELHRQLFGLPEEDIEERISFYSEMIDDRMEDGVPEEEAVAGIGTVEEVAEQILSETPLVTIVREKVRPKRALKTWEKVLLIIGSPVWGALLIAAIAVLLSLYIALWAVVVSLYAVCIALAAAAVCCLPAAAKYLFEGNIAGAAFAFGAVLVCAGLAILMVFVCVKITRGVLKLTRKMFRRNKKAK